jgi:hypothetical protein
MTNGPVPHDQELSADRSCEQLGGGTFISCLLPTLQECLYLMLAQRKINNHCPVR